jgi:DNA polymerase-3 subunit gamma/tau
MLYRKYRPNNFSEFIGQKHVVLTLKNQILQNKIAHAYLFSGPRGTGKTTLARIFAKAINCLNLKENVDPCNNCNNCISINKGSFIDFIEIDAASKRGIDEIRDIIEGVKVRPFIGKKKVFVIDECHSLTKEAANAFLKTLEEPPDYVVFILATTEPEKVIPTILSRTQKFQFRFLTSEEIFEKLKKIKENEKINIEDEALKLIAQQANGSLRDAETILDKILNFSNNITREDIENFFGMVKKDFILSFFEALRDKNKKKLLEILNNIYLNGYDLVIFVDEILRFLRGVALVRVNPELKNLVLSDFIPEDFEKIYDILKEISLSDIQNFINIFLESYWQIKREPPILILPLELAILKI